MKTTQVIYCYYYLLPVWVVATYDIHKISSCCFVEQINQPQQLNHKLTEIIPLHVSVLLGVWALMPSQGVLRSMPK